MARPSNPELRDDILKAAAFIIEDCGPDCVTMRQVADRIGYSPTTIYLYFKDKSAVLRASVHAALEELRETCELAAVGPRELDKLRQRSRAYVVWGIMHPGHYRLIFEYSDEIQLSDKDLDLVRDAVAWQHESIAVARDAGEFTGAVDPVEVGRDIWSALHGATSLAASGRLAAVAQAGHAAQVSEMATRTADRLVNGIVERLAS